MTFILSELVYPYNALEPYISEDVMRYHYEGHYTKYCNNLNQALKNYSNFSTNIVEILKTVSFYDKEVRNNGGGYYNHNIFWKLLSPNKTDLSYNLLSKINEKYSSLDNFREQIINHGMNIFGSGWAWLVLDKNKELKIITTCNQDNPIMDIFEEYHEPLLGIDVWEHAYYLQYKNDRKNYLNNIFNVINWEFVNQLYNQHK